MQAIADRIKELTEQLSGGNFEVLDKLVELKMEQELREKCLAMHTTPITYTAGRWRTRIGSRQIFKTKRSDLEDVIVAHYSSLLQRKTIIDAFAGWIDEKEEFEENRKSSLTRYKTDAKRFFKSDDPLCSLDLNIITASDLERYIKRTIKRCNLTRKSYRGLSILLHGALRYAKREGWTEFSAGIFFDDLVLPDNLFTKKPPKKDSEEIFDENEVGLLTARFQDSPTLLNLGLRLMFLSGIRVGELSSLRLSSVDLDALTLDISASEIQYDDENGRRVFDVEDMPKTDEGRRKVFLPNSAETILRQIIAARPSQDTEWLFAYPDGRRMRSKAFNRALQRACRKVGIPERTTHKIRKTYASAMIDADVSAKIIQKQMGHKDFATTKKYYDRDRTGDDYKRNEINRAINI